MDSYAKWFILITLEKPQKYKYIILLLCFKIVCIIPTVGGGVGRN